MTNVSGVQTVFFGASPLKNNASERRRHAWQRLLLGAAMSVGLAHAAVADDAPASATPNINVTSGLPSNVTVVAQATTSASAPTPAGCTGPVDPYANYACLDQYLGSDIIGRFFNYYLLEMGHAVAPSDPNAPPGSRDNFPPAPETTPPMPFTDWPYGGTESLGHTRPAGADSPLMVAIANTGLGQWMADEHMQFYGWVDPGGNISSNQVKPGGNAPVAYAYTPNTVQLDQAVVYLDRWPDTVQSDHIDWGFRLSAIYGENYRYTTAYGIASYQLLKNNQVNGYDFPMEWVEAFIPWIGQAGTIIRIGRYISLPDIEAQLAPNNYMYTHSLTYAVDNYTNEGIVATVGVTNQFFLQVGVETGTEAPPWHLGSKIPNEYVLSNSNAAGFGPGVDPFNPNKTMLQDPGDKLAGTLCARYTTADGNDDINLCANGINTGQWGYNNLQWYGLTAYHKWNDHWHISFEAYDEHENNVPNENNPQVVALYNNGGLFNSPQYMPYNAPDLAVCKTTTQLDCTMNAAGAVAYISYSPEPLDNISLRPEYYDDFQGQRTGTKTAYFELSLGWQHWLSPQIEFRPELGYYKALSAHADPFNGDADAGIPGDKSWTLLAASDVIVHF
ncbi:MAG: outer membrane beta-barrel protein [Rhizomicrobium sp.]